MRNMLPVFFILYCACAVVNTGAILAGAGTVHIVSKCLLMPLLAAYYRASAPVFSVLIVLALLFGWLGDVALVLGGGDYVFFAGLACFLVAHIFYLARLLRFHKFRGYSAGTLASGIVSLCALLAVEAAVIAVMRFPREFMLPFAVYGCVLALMAAAALALCGNGMTPAKLMTASGALLFFVSDNTLGCFVVSPDKNKYVDVFIMATYIAAQFCLVRGMARLPDKTAQAGGARTV